MDNKLGFVALTPSNREAIRAFSKVVDMISTDPHHFAHHRKFLVSSATRSPLSSLLRGTSIASSGGSGTDAETEPNATTEPVELLWTGSYHISLGTYPHPPSTSWRAGSGRWTERNPTGNIELFLSCGKNDGIRGNHADFAFDKATGILMLNARHAAQNGVKLNASLFGRKDGSRALNTPTAIIQMGRLEYSFAYTIDPNSAEERAFQEDKVVFFRNVLKVAPPIESTSATPSANNMVIGDWTLHGTAGTGAFGIVSAASHRYGGSVVAFKRIDRGTHPQAELVAQEVRVAQELISCSNEAGSYSDFVIRLKQVIYERGHAEWDGSFEHVYILYTPLARGTFQSHLLQLAPQLSRNILISLFAQILKGVAYLHSSGWIHRDLKPANLGVVSLDPPHAVILDLGQAIHVDPSLIGRENSSGFIPQTPGRVGTRSYLAPEMEKSLYSETVDIWALGVVAHELFLGYYPFKISMPANPWLPTTNPQFIKTLEEFKKRINELGEAKNDPIELLIQQMFWWRPEARVQANDALRHPALEGAITEISSKDASKAHGKRSWVSD